MKTIDAYQIKPLDGLASGTVRPFAKDDFDRLSAMGALREATADEVKAAQHLNKMAPAGQNKDIGGQRDQNGDTAEMAEMRRRFGQSWNDLVIAHDETKTKLGEASVEVNALKIRVTDLEALLSDKDAEIENLKSERVANGVPGAYVVSEKSAGWFAISRDGKELTKSLRKDAVDRFETLDEAAKAAFVEANKIED